MSRKPSPLILKIRALMAKTVANGCTEAEALSAAAKVAAMMAEHEISLEDVEREELEFETRSRPVVDDVGWVLWKVASAIEELTCTRSFTDEFGKQTSKLSFFGREDDVEIAGYLLDIVEIALRSGLAANEKAIAFFTNVHRRRKRLSYLDGMVDSMSRSIREIAWTRHRKDEAAKALAVSKDAALREAMKSKGLALSTGGRQRGAYDFDPFYDIGKQDGAEVRFDAGLGGNRPAGLLGKDGS